MSALANSAKVENRPTRETATSLMDELLFQRVTQIYVWALPLINTLGMKVGSERVFGAGDNGHRHPCQRFPFQLQHSLVNMAPLLGSTPHGLHDRMLEGGPA